MLCACDGLVEERQALSVFSSPRRHSFSVLRHLIDQKWKWKLFLLLGGPPCGSGSACIMRSSDYIIVRLTVIPPMANLSVLLM